MQSLVNRDIFGERWWRLSEKLLLIKTHSRRGYSGGVSLVGCFLSSLEVELNIIDKTQIGVGGGKGVLKGKKESWVVVVGVWGHQEQQQGVLE